MTLETVREMRILRAEDGVSIDKTETVVIEHGFCINVNKRRKADLIVTPQYLEELTLGHLYTSGIIKSLADITELAIDDGLQTARVQTTGDNSSTAPDAVLEDFFVPLTDILNAMEKFLHESKMFFVTGAVHSCALMIGGRLLHFMEDIGRHNAFDKTIGAALRTETPLDQAVVLTSGRLPSDMMSKVIYSRVPVVVSRSAPTDAAVELAERCNVTLCGFARGRRINIYTGRQRIIF